MYAQANGLNLDEILNISIPTFKPVFVPESRFTHFMRTIGITLISGALSFGIAFVGTSILMGSSAGSPLPSSRRSAPS